MVERLGKIGRTGLSDVAFPLTAALSIAERGISSPVLGAWVPAK